MVANRNLGTDADAGRDRREHRRRRQRPVRRRFRVQDLHLRRRAGHRRRRAGHAAAQPVERLLRAVRRPLLHRAQRRALPRPDHARRRPRHVARTPRSSGWRRRSACRPCWTWPTGWGCGRRCTTNDAGADAGPEVGRPAAQPAAVAVLPGQAVVHARQQPGQPARAGERVRDADERRHVVPARPGPVGHRPVRARGGTAAQACEQAVPTGLANTLMAGLSKDTTEGTSAAAARDAATGPGRASARPAPPRPASRWRSSAASDGYAVSSLVFADGAEPGELCPGPPVHLGNCGHGAFGGTVAAPPYFAAHVDDPRRPRATSRCRDADPQYDGLVTHGTS